MNIFGDMIVKGIGCQNKGGISMFVSLYKEKKIVHKMLAYGLVNKGVFEKVIVHDAEKKQFYLVDRFDMKDDSLDRNIYTIQHDTYHWKIYEGESLQSHFKNIDIDYLFISPLLMDHLPVLHEILQNGHASSRSCSLLNHLPKDSDYWNYVLTDEDVKVLMEKNHDFHDAIISSITYSGSYTDGDHVELTLSQYNTTRKLILRFEAVQKFRMDPPGEYSSREIFSGTIAIDNGEIIFLIDNPYLEVVALNLKWGYAEVE